MFRTSSVVVIAGGYGMDSGNTAWVLMSSALVFIMIPGLAFFYGGLVRRKNAAATMMQSFIAIALVGVTTLLESSESSKGTRTFWYIANLHPRNVSSESLIIVDR